MMASIEKAMIARLKAASDSGILGYTLREVTSYPADWDLYLKDALVNCPAAWVTFGGWAPVASSRGGAQVRGSFGLVVAAQNVRNEVATRHGAETAVGHEVGSYQMVLDACGLFQGHDLGLGIGGLEVGALQFVRPIPALQQRKWSMLALQFTTVFQIRQLDLPDTQQLADFATFDVKWEVPSIDDVPGAQIAHDVVTLPTDPEPMTEE